MRRQQICLWRLVMLIAICGGPFFILDQWKPEGMSKEDVPSSVWFLALAPNLILGFAFLGILDDEDPSDPCEGTVVTVGAIAALVVCVESIYIIIAICMTNVQLKEQTEEDKGIIFLGCLMGLTASVTYGRVFQSRLLQRHITSLQYYNNEEDVNEEDEGTEIEASIS